MMPTGCISYAAWCSFVAIGCIVGSERGISTGQTLLTFFLGIFLVPVVYLLVVGWSSGGNAPAGTGKRTVDDVIRHYDPNGALTSHSEYYVNELARVAYEHGTNGRGPGIVGKIVLFESDLQRSAHPTNNYAAVLERMAHAGDNDIEIVMKRGNRP